MTEVHRIFDLATGDGDFEALADYFRANAICVLGSALVPQESIAEPLPEGFFERGYTPALTALTRERLEAAVYITDLNPHATLVTCGRNPNNYYDRSDAQVMAEAAKDYDVKNPLIALERPFTTATELLDITALAAKQEWQHLILITNRPFVVRVMAMMRDITNLPNASSHLTVINYLGTLYGQYYNRRDDIDYYYKLTEALQQFPYSGSYSITTPAPDKHRFGETMITPNELTGIRDWVKGQYGLFR